MKPSVNCIAKTWNDDVTKNNQRLTTELPSTEGERNATISIKLTAASDKSLKPADLLSSDINQVEESIIRSDYHDESCFHIEKHPKQRLDRMNAENEASSLINKALPNSAEESINDDIHVPRSLPIFPDPQSCMWTSSHDANCPSEDRSSSLVNILLRPESECIGRSSSLIRLSLWSVIDGHGGGCVATYASEVLLPHIAASVSRALQCKIVDRGVCTVNGELRNADALDLDGLIHTSDHSRTNPHSVQYQVPHESQQETDSDCDDQCSVSEDDPVTHMPLYITRKERQRTTSVDAATSSPHAGEKTVAQQLPRAVGPAGTHSPLEIVNVTKALTDSFLAVDEGWINSIDPIATHQTSCQSNGRWNAGACALVVFTVQRLDWMETSIDEQKTSGATRVGHDTSYNQDAARRRMLDYFARGKSVSSVSSLSSASSMLTDDPYTESAIDSEITETDDAFGLDESHRNSHVIKNMATTPPFHQCLIKAPGGCQCHAYRARQAMLYTAHVGDCRAVLLGSEPPCTIKVRPMAGPSLDQPDTTDDELSYHSSDETECLSSSDHDAETSDEDCPAVTTPQYLSHIRRPATRQRRKPRDVGNHEPFFAFPPLRSASIISEEESEAGIEQISQTKLFSPRVVHTGMDSENNRGSNETLSSTTRELSTPLHLAPFTCPTDLTTDHSAYNPVEVDLVRRRCNNAPGAISAGIGGGIKRVAGSLAVTRALGDAYLKTPLLSFDPYRHSCPYITARPETNYRLLSPEGDTVLILATDGVWERCNGEDILRWIRNYSAERIADSERKNSKGRRIDTDSICRDDHGTEWGQGNNDNVLGQKRDHHASSPVSLLLAKKRKVGHHPGLDSVATVADVIVRRVLNKVRKARNMTSLQALTTLPKGRARRSKHDDMTASVVALSAFVSPQS